MTEDTPAPPQTCKTENNSKNAMTAYAIMAFYDFQKAPSAEGAVMRVSA